MAFCAATTTSIQASIEPTIEPVRPFANFPPSIWGDRFLSFSLDNPLTKDMLGPKEELRRLIVEPTMDSNEKLSLIYSVYRLGLKYNYIEEIEGVLDKLFKELNLEEYKETDLYTISVNFQVFRLHGYRLSCDVFNKFKDYSSGRFKEYIKNDIKGLLSFYESTQLKIRGETILDEAMAFTEAQLKSVVDTLVGNLERQVKHALRSPFHRGLPMVEASLYFSNYEEECSTYDSISKLANTHFNYLQIIQKEELYVVSKWSKDVEFHIITPYARERIPELYLWALAICFEPNYSQGRIIISKIAQLITVLDDSYDAYATIEELRVLTDAINRWCFSAMDLLPLNVKGFYHVILNEYVEFEKQVSKEGRTNRVNTSKEAFQDLARGYLQEAEWRHEGHVPSFQEYLNNGLSTSTYKVFLTSCLMGMGKLVNEEALGWYVSHPKVMKSLELIGRLYNDVTSYQFENERAQKQVTSVDAYMKNFAVPENVAIDELKKMIENGWKDINEGCLKPTQVSMELLAPILNLARMTDVTYRYIDKFTFPEMLVEEYITLLFGKLLNNLRKIMYLL